MPDGSPIAPSEGKAERTRILVPIVILAIVVLVGTYAAIEFAHVAAVREERGRLLETVQSQARLIEAIDPTTETRDPYAAGHQRRVTALAVAIAEELGLENTAIEGTRAAGLLHDIGKMAVPAEILSRSGHLTATEMALIQSHPQVAYDILKSVSFPWPLAEIVLQHYERVDGSGYPQGLSGEARVLAVADVAEAMASHRPYRAALGVEAALAEVEAGRETLYDGPTVDACLRLFRERQFRFADAA